MPNTDQETQAPAPGSDEYNAKMAAIGRGDSDNVGQEVDTPEVPAMPEQGVEKFYNAETGAYDWQNHARELQYRIEQKGQESPDPTNKDQEQSSDDTNNNEADAAADIITNAGLSVDDLESTLQTSGDLTDEQKTALRGVGIPDSLMDSYVSMYKAAAETAKITALDYVGGQAEWDSLNKWVAESMPETEKAAWNSMLQSADWKVAVDALKAKRGASKPGYKEGALTVSGEGNQSTPSGYTSRAQQQADMQDPRYKSDPSFRKQVYEKTRHASWGDEGRY